MLIGWPFHSPSDLIEVVDLEDNSFECLKDLTFNSHTATYAPGGGLIRSGDEFVPFLCGGGQYGNEKCYQLNSTRYGVRST